MDALDLDSAVLVGYDWGGRAACIVAALWPERCRGLVTVGAYNIQDIANADRPAPVSEEYRYWYQWYFNTERGRAGLEQDRRAICRLLWQLWSPTWSFDDETFDRTAASFDNPDFVDVVIHSYRHRYGAAPGDPALEWIERRLADRPPILVSTVVLHGAADGVTPPTAEAEDAGRFLGPYERHVVPNAGHLLPREAPDAIVSADQGADRLAIRSATRRPAAGGHPDRPVLHSRPVRDLIPSRQNPSPAPPRRGAHTRTVPDRDGAGPATRWPTGPRRRRPRRNRTDRRSLTVPSVSMRQLLEAGVHFGHQTRRWNPKMKPFIFAERNGIHIIDLAQTVQRLDVALEFVSETVARGEQVLFVGTKKQAQEPIAQEATRANQPYVNKRWLGGMLTNFVTIKKRIGLLEQLEARQANGDFERMTKKEAAKLTEEMTKLQGTLGGMRKMKRLPGAIFIVDPHRERIGVTEANKLEIPVVGTGDTNVDPDELDFIIPANDDAIRAIRLLCTLVADAAIEGARERSARSATEPEQIEAMAMPEAEEEVPGATDELVAALAGGAALSFEPDADDDDLLPGDRVARAEAAVAEPPAEATPEEIAAELAREAAEKADDSPAAG